MAQPAVRYSWLIDHLLRFMISLAMATPDSIDHWPTLAEISNLTFYLDCPIFTLTLESICSRLGVRLAIAKKDRPSPTTHLYGKATARWL